LGFTVDCLDESVREIVVVECVGILLGGIGTDLASQEREGTDKDCQEDAFRVCSSAVLASAKRAGQRWVQTFGAQACSCTSS
jgi:hypothetical protein